MSLKTGNYLNANGEEEFAVGLGALPQKEGATLTSRLFQLIDGKLRSVHQNIKGNILIMEYVDGSFTLLTPPPQQLMLSIATLLALPDDVTEV